MSFSGNRTLCPLQRKPDEPQGTNINVQRREKFLPLTLFNRQTVSPAQSTGRVKTDSETSDVKNRPPLGYYTNISVQTTHENRNTLNGQLRNDE
jgi:hypothetical protein